MLPLSRRRFLQGSLALAGVSLVSGCGVVSAPAPPPRIPRIGYLASGVEGGPTAEAFLDGLRELGYVDGQTIKIEYRWAEGHEERLPRLATELVALNVEAIYAWGTLPARAAKDATSTLPIVFGASGDPVGAGLVASLARPGGNVTGMSAAGSVLAAKRAEWFKEAVPGRARVAVLAYAAGAATEHDWAETYAAGRGLGLDLRRHDVGVTDDLQDVFGAIAAQGAEGLLVLQDSFFGRNLARLMDLVARHRLPGMYEHRNFSAAGGLLSYGANLPDLYRRSATYVDKIIKGASPADLPVEQPTRFDFVVNLRTAQVLGLTIPRSALMQATEIIE